MITTGERIKQLRQEHCLTQEKFGGLIGVSKHAVSLYEASKNLPSDDVKIKIASHFGVSIDWLLGISNLRSLVTAFNTKDPVLMDFCNKLQSRGDLRQLVNEIKDLPPQEALRIPR
jgi:transcriptional regulator with XRE-family HTH domain